MKEVPDLRSHHAFAILSPQQIAGRAMRKMTAYQHSAQLKRAVFPRAA